MTTMIFEARVRVGHGDNAITKMYHFTCRTAKQATKLASKRGRCLSVRKNQSAMYSRIEKLDLTPTIYEQGNLYPDAVAMGEMPWKKKPRRLNKKPDGST